MFLSIYGNVLVQGVLTGLVYGLMALGLSVIFGVVRIVNFAHGELAVLAMYATVVLANLFGLDPLVSLVPVAVLFFVVGYWLQRLLIDPFVGRPEHQQFILMVGLAIILVNAALIGFGPGERNVPLPYAFDSWDVGPLFVDKVRVYAAGAAVLLCAALFAFFRTTDTGAAIRACSDNLVGAAVVGLDVKRLYALTFGIGLACVGAAGSLLVMLFDARPGLGPAYTLLAFTIVIVGGMGSMVGALVGGVLVGVAEALASILFSPSLKTMASFGLLVLVLALRPQGLLGRRA